MVARSAGCEQQVLSTASLAASSNRDPHYVRLITDDATDFASKIRCSQQPSYSKLYSLTVPVYLRDYFCGCFFWANTSVRPYGLRYYLLCSFVRTGVLKLLHLRCEGRREVTAPFAFCENLLRSLRVQASLHPLACKVVATTGKPRVSEN